MSQEPQLPLNQQENQQTQKDIINIENKDQIIQDIQQTQEIEEIKFQNSQSQNNCQQYQSPYDEIYEAQEQNFIDYHTGQNNSGKHINEYEILETLGEGSFGKIKKVLRSFIDEETKQIITAYYAMKKYDKNVLQQRRMCRYDNSNEPKMMNHLDIITNEEDNFIYLICQFGNLGQIMNWDVETQMYIDNVKVIEFITDKYKIKDKNNREQIAKIIFKQICYGVKYLHDQDIVHRDLKLDNILCKSDEYPEEIDADIKIADFNTSRQLQKNETILFDCAGTPGYRSPEHQFSSGTGYLAKPCDIWSLGICIYAFISYLMPFLTESELETDILAKNEPIKYDDRFSPEIIQLIEGMCQKEPEKRLTIEQVLESKWFQIIPEK